MLLLPRRLQKISNAFLPFIGYWATFGLAAGQIWSIPFINQLELIVLKVDRLALLFSFVFTVLTFLASIFALHVKRPGEMAAAFYMLVAHWE